MITLFLVNSGFDYLITPLLLLAILTLFELIFSVSLILTEDFEENDFEEIKDELKESEVFIIKRFFSKRKKYEGRFHCALIVTNIFMAFPLISILDTLVDDFFVGFLDTMYSFLNNLLNGITVIHWDFLSFFILSDLFIIVVLLIYFILNYCFFFSLPRKIIRFCQGKTKAKLTVISVKYSAFMIPVADFSESIINGLFKLFGKTKINDEEEITEEDIKTLVNESQDHGVLEEDEVEMINNIFELNDKEAKDIMTNRNSIVAINADTPLDDAIKIMLDGNNSRYPVYIDNLDHIIGLLNLRDALRYQKDNPQRNGAIKRYPKLLREARFVSETRKIDDLFSKMQADKLQVVIVIDEYGQTSGIVSMEDIVEEIVGNILDEYDEEETFIESKGEKKYEIDGLTPLLELEDKFNVKFDEEDIETLSGFIISKIGKIPSEDEVIEIIYENLKFKTLQIENHVIKNVLMEIMEKDIVEESELNTQDIENEQEK